MNFKKWISARNNESPVNQANNYISKFHKDIDDLFDNVFRNFGFNKLIDNGKKFTPDIDLIQNDNEYKIIVDVPGINENDLRVDLEGNVLTIMGEKKQELTDNKKNYHHIERFYGNFERSFTLPKDSDSENIDASFKNGVLSIIVKRIPQLKLSSKKINIKKLY